MLALFWKKKEARVHFIKFMSSLYNLEKKVQSNRVSTLNVQKLKDQSLYLNCPKCYILVP